MSSRVKLVFGIGQQILGARVENIDCILGWMHGGGGERRVEKTGEQNRPPASRRNRKV